MKVKLFILMLLGVFIFNVTGCASTMNGTSGNVTSEGVFPNKQAVQTKLSDSSSQDNDNSNNEIIKDVAIGAGIVLLTVAIYFGIIIPASAALGEM